MLLDFDHVEAVVLQQGQIRQHTIQIKARFTINVRAKGKDIVTEDWFHGHRSLLYRAQFDTGDEIPLQEWIDDQDRNCGDNDLRAADRPIR